MTADNVDKQPTQLTKSQQESAYFAIGDSYDPLVYENTNENWVKIIGAFIVFYVFQALHWIANFELAMAAPASSTLYNLIIFVCSVTFILIFIFVGNIVNRKVMTHEFYTEKISEQKQRLAEAEAKAKQKAEMDARRQGTNA